MYKVNKVRWPYWALWILGIKQPKATQILKYCCYIALLHRSNIEWINVFSTIWCTLFFKGECALKSHFSSNIKGWKIMYHHLNQHSSSQWSFHLHYHHIYTADYSMYCIYFCLQFFISGYKCGEHDHFENS